MLKLPYAHTGITLDYTDPVYNEKLMLIIDIIEDIKIYTSKYNVAFTDEVRVEIFLCLETHTVSELGLMYRDTAIGDLLFHWDLFPEDEEE
jgi:hypothetical protein